MIARKNIFCSSLLTVLALGFMGFVTDPDSKELPSPSPRSICDDGGQKMPYQENASFRYVSDTIQICPKRTGKHIAKITFEAFDIAPGDRLRVFDGLEPNRENEIRSKDFKGYGYSLADAPGKGEVEASPANRTGCLSMVFTKNNDTIRGAGYCLKVENIKR